MAIAIRLSVLLVSISLVCPTATLTSALNSNVNVLGQVTGAGSLTLDDATALQSTTADFTNTWKTTATSATSSSAAESTAMAGEQ